MTDSSRKVVLTRRANALVDFGGLKVTDGELLYNDFESKGIFTVNCSFQVGIATSTETGLSTDRFPIRVVIGTAPTDAETVITACRYWSITTSSLANIPFSRRPIQNTNPLETLYKRIEHLDRNAWGFIRKWSELRLVHVAELDGEQNALYQSLCVVSPTAQQLIDFKELVDRLYTEFRTRLIYPYFKIGEDMYLRCKPVGEEYVPTGNLTASQVAIYEALCMVKINSARIKARYPAVADGLVTMNAWAIATMFRSGIHEAFEHKEYHTVYVSPKANAPATFTVNAFQGSQDFVTPLELEVGRDITIGDVKGSSQVVELANMLVVSSGLMHYLFNHTTGGTKVTGTLLSVLAMYKFIDQSYSDKMIEDATSVLYQALHPVNKRAVANIFFDCARVFTYGRSSRARPIAEYTLDTFATIRKNPFPAGTHKAFMCLAGLKRILGAQLAPFLPWATDIPNVVTTCAEVLKAGAYAHVGSHYYTGLSPMTQGSALDNYLPEVAAFVQIFHPYDSLAMSPHLSREVQNRANSNWTAMLRKLKGEDISNTPVEVIQKYLGTLGMATSTFNPADETTWAAAKEVSESSIRLINSVFTHAAI